MRMNSGRTLGIALLVAGALPGGAWAHGGHATAASFAAGAVHPFGGLDHLLAMIAVGVWAAHAGGRDGRSSWSIPLGFLAFMAIGGGLGMSGVGGRWIETGIVGSVLLTGGLIVAAPRLPALASITLVGLFALAHGLAHGGEMEAGLDGLGYGAGFVVASMLLLGIGFGLGRATASLAGGWLPKATGGAVILGGLALALAG